MNRSILIVIADFLLVSLLAFSSFDASKLGEEPPTTQFKPNLAPEMSAADNQEVMGVLKGALEDERRTRQQLIGELNLTKEEALRRQNLAAEREKQNQTYLQTLQQKEQQTRQLEQERQALLQQFQLAQTNLQTLQQQLKNANAGALQTREKLAALEAELRKEQAVTAATQQQLAKLENTRQTLETEKQQLSQKLQVVEAEKRLTSDQLNVMQGEVQTVRSEKTQILQHADKLAEGVTTLAQSSDKLADKISSLSKNSVDLSKEVREFRPLAANTIFNEFISNRVHTQMNAFRSRSLVPDQNRRRETETILLTDKTNYFAVCHVDDTPFTFWSPGVDWEKLSGTLSRSAAQIPIEKVSFYLLDPRIVLIPISAARVPQLKCKVYPISTEPFKFPDAVLVGAREGYYGECRFQIDLTTPQYVKMDHSFFKGLFGKFNPSRGDLVFTKTGELLGIMANSTYCIVIHNFSPSATFRFGEDVLTQKTGADLSMFYRQLVQLPVKLQ